MIVIKKDSPGCYDVRYDKVDGTIIGFFEQDIDGFYYFWPEHRGGMYSQELLLGIGEKLKELNKSYQDAIDDYFEGKLDD